MQDVAKTTWLFLEGTSGEELFVKAATLFLCAIQRSRTTDTKQKQINANH